MSKTDCYDIKTNNSDKQEELRRFLKVKKVIIIEPIENYTKIDSLIYDEKGFVSKEILRYIENEKLAKSGDSDFKWEVLNKINLYKYDDNGNATEISEFTLDSLLIKKHIFRYQINLVKEFSIYNAVDDKTTLLSKYEYKFDSSCNIIEKINLGSKNDIQTIIKRKYNSKGNNIEERWFYNDGTVFSYSSLQYDNNNNLTKKTIKYFYRNETTERYNFIYDSNGLLTKEIEVQENGDKINEKEYFYEF